MAAKHKEKAFEDEVLEQLSLRGWSEGAAAGYDRSLGLFFR